MIFPLPLSSYRRVCSVLCVSLALGACHDDNSNTASPVDDIPPAVSSTSPVDGALDAARTSDITATFNEDIFAITVDDASFSLVNASSESVSGSVSFDAIGNIASFTPAARLAMQADYTATLSTAITDLSGNPMEADYAFSFTTGDGEWKAPDKVQSNETNSGLYPQLAMNSNGVVMAVWLQSDDGYDSIWANSFDGSVWGTAQLIENNSLGNAEYPQVAMSANGNALAIWAQSDGTRKNIWANHFDGTDWGTAQLLETDNAGNAEEPQIAVYADGKALAVWTQSDGTRKNIWANYFDGSAWGTAQLIETDNAGNADVPQIAVDGDGNAIAVWAQLDGTRKNIWANRFNGSAWGTAQLIENYDAWSAEYPQISVGADGSAVVVWYQYDGSNYNIWANHFDGSAWGTAQTIESEASNGFNPRVAVNSSGRAVAVWRMGSSNDNIWANHFDGSAWGTAQLIEDDAESARDPRIAIDAEGRALAVWMQALPSPYRIRSNRFDGSTWGSDQLSGNASGYAQSPQIAMNSEGFAWAVWTQDDGSGYSIWANRFE